MFRRKHRNSVPIAKEIDNGKSLKYKINDSFRFMSSSLSSLADNRS